MTFKIAEARHDLMNNTAVIYFEGNGVPEDLVVAAQWYLRSAKAGNVVGQYRLGQCYWFGEGVLPELRRRVDLHVLGFECGATGEDGCRQRHADRCDSIVHERPRL